MQPSVHPWGIAMSEEYSSDEEEEYNLTGGRPHFLT